MTSDAHPTAPHSSVPDFTAHFADLTDPRIQRGKQHQLLDIVGLTIYAVIAGADTFTGVERFGHARREWLKQFLDLEGGIPSHDTLGRVWSRVCPTEFETGFRRWIARLAENLEEVVAIDGKTLRRSYDRRDSKAALQMISVWSCANEVVLGQRAVPEATNETKTLPALLRVLHLEGAIVTIDAAGTYPEISAQIQEAGADYVIGLKGNQKSLYRDVKATFDAREAIGRLPAPCRSVDGGHDRVEVRHCWGLDLADTGLKAERLAADGWTGLRTIGRVRAERHRPDGTVETEDRLFLSSLPAEPERLLRAVRHHWHVENKLHWSLDVAFREDDSRVRTGHAAQNLAVVRRLALSLLKQETSRTVGIAIKRKEAAWNPDYLLKVLTVGN